jgi:hypothetical protein
MNEFVGRVKLPLSREERRIKSVYRVVFAVITPGSFQYVERRFKRYKQAKIFYDKKVREDYGPCHPGNNTGLVAFYRGRFQLEATY